MMAETKCNTGLITMIQLIAGPGSCVGCWRKHKWNGGVSMESGYKYHQGWESEADTSMENVKVAAVALDSTRVSESFYMYDFGLFHITWEISTGPGKIWSSISIARALASSSSIDIHVRWGHGDTVFILVSEPLLGSTLKHCDVPNAFCNYVFPLCCYLPLAQAQCHDMAVQVTMCVCLQLHGSFIVSFIYLFIFHQLFVLKCHEVTCTQETGVAGTVFLVMFTYRSILVDLLPPNLCTVWKSWVHFVSLPQFCTHLWTVNLIPIKSSET